MTTTHWLIIIGTYCFGQFMAGLVNDRDRRDLQQRVDRLERELQQR